MPSNHGVPLSAPACASATDNRFLAVLAQVRCSLRYFTDTLAGSDAAWIVGHRIARIGLYVLAMRNQRETDAVVEGHPSLRAVLASAMVTMGPFRGMRYGGIHAVRSALWPKLLGTYEQELHDFVISLTRRKPGMIVNVGAAEGYYSVGFALRFPGVPVVAYEQDLRGRVNIRKLAAINGVADRVKIQRSFGPSDMALLPDAAGLLVMDCEGAEERLITAGNVGALKNWDLIIETHDGYHSGVTKRLCDLLVATHEVQVIEAIHDADRADRLSLPDVLDRLPRQEVDALLAERRIHACLRWIVARSRRETRSA
jgi:hypothetical protein